MAVTTSFESRSSRSGFLTAFLLGAGLFTTVTCSTPTITTPTRTLDRPSDVALYCVELEVPDCLPKQNPDDDPEAYLAAYCAQSTRDIAVHNQPLVNVLTLDECNEERRSLRDHFYLDKVHRAVQLTGRNPDAPCCPADNPSCGQEPPVCSRRMLAALIANTTRGELAVADTQSQAPGLTTIGRLENLHGGEPGFGFLPTGLLPEHVRSYSPPQSILGPGGRRESPNAWAVTANAGSCDLSMVDLQKIAQLAAQPAKCQKQGEWCPTRDCTADSCPHRVEPWLPGPAGTSRPLRARPAWIEVAPWSKDTRRAVFVAYPTCGMVATIDLNNGQVFEAVGFDPSGTPKVLSASELQNLSCAADCGNDSGAVLMPDPNTLPAGGVPGVAAYPLSLAVEPATERLIIGNSVGEALTIVDFDGSAPDGSHFRGPPRSLRLDFHVLPDRAGGGQRGIGAIRVSPRTATGQFAYVVTRDSTVRVVDLDREVECETNPDARYLQAQAGGSARVLPDELNDSNLRRLGCLPVGTSGLGGTPRAPLSFGPGISLPDGSLPRDNSSRPSGSLPRDIGFVHVDANTCDVTDPNCGYAPGADSTKWTVPHAWLWIGDYAWLLGGAGLLTAVQVADACPAPSYRACFPEAAALRRIAFLNTRSQFQPTSPSTSLQSLYQALMVTPSDRLMNVRRPYSRFEESSTATYGPRTESDVSGVPTFTASVGGTQVSYFATLADPQITNGRPRLMLPAPAPYYYLPVDPVCDVALSAHAFADPSNLVSPDPLLTKEPMRRPVSMMHFVDTNSFNDGLITLDWEGMLPGSDRATGRMLNGNQLIDLNGNFCSNGVETGDKLWLAGCQSDRQCPSGSTCQRESTQGSAPGICLTKEQRMACQNASLQLLAEKSRTSSAWLATWFRRYRIIKAEQQIPTASGDVADRLTVDEIPEPEYELERRACTTLGDTASCAVPIILPGRPIDVSKPPPQLSCRMTGRKAGGTPDLSCVLGCTSNDDCGVGFVCAKSQYEADEERLGGKPLGPRCMRAPLLDPSTLNACFPDLINYEVHGGDAFVVRGNRSKTPSLVQRASDGTCQRPPKGSASYQTSRLLEPRLRLGPSDSLPDDSPLRCAVSANDWISHRIKPSLEAIEQPSCKLVRPPSPSGTPDPNNPPRISVTLPGTDQAVLELVRGEDFPLSRKNDPWLSSEYELFSSLPLDDKYNRNQCILTDNEAEEYPDGQKLRSCYAPNGVSDRICRFPGDHTEFLGVRRIHYESPWGNLVLRVPRVLRDPTKPYSVCTDPTKPCVCADPKASPCTQFTYNDASWAIPPDGYSVSFTVLGALVNYQQFAETAQRDVSSGIRAQGLRSATAAPSGALFIVDEGRTGSLSSLRGQVLRVYGSQVDPFFLLR